MLRAGPDAGEIRERFGLTDFVQLRLPSAMPRLDVAPTIIIPIVEQEDGRTLKPMSWDFWPACTAPGTRPPVNERVETHARYPTAGVFAENAGTTSSANSRSERIACSCGSVPQAKTQST